MAFKLMKLSELSKLDSNPRTISEKSFKTLCKSIKDNPDYFNARPLILSDRTGELVIIAGNQRYEAAKHLKIKEVPTYLISGLTLEKENEIIIRDNVNNGEWDWDRLGNEWNQTDLEDWGVPIFWKGVDENELNDEDFSIDEDFDAIGNSSNMQRVVFLFDTPDHAESYLNNNNINFVKRNMAWQVNFSSKQSE